MNQQRSSAAEFFGRIVESTDPIAFLRTLVTDRAVEGEWLEFKGAEKLDDGTAAKKKWSTALSGFANTEGGVIIWGIDARKDSTTGVDSAQSLSLVQAPDAFRSRLMDLHHAATDPPVIGVESVAYRDPNSNGAGFVVCLIPESRFKPHRAEQDGHKAYYIRAGDDFVNPSPSLLRNLFFPHTNSSLWVEIAAKWPRNQNPLSVSFHARIHNSGTATARDVFVVLQSAQTLESITPCPEWSKASNPQGQAAFEGRRPLHPGSMSELFWCQIRSPIVTEMNPSGPEAVPGLVGCEFRLLMYAADREPQEAAIRFDRDEIVGQAAKKGTTEFGQWHRHSP